MRGGRNFTCQGLTFVSSYSSDLLLECSCNIAKASQMMSPLLDVWEPPFEETLDWIRFAYTADRTGVYVAPVPTVFSQPAVSEGDPLFPAI